MQKLTATLNKSTKVTHDTHIYEFSLEPDQITIKPGQFVSLTINLNGGTEKCSRSYSVAGFGEGAVAEGATVKTKNIKLLIRTIPDGKATPVIESFTEGTKIPLMGASGLLTPPEDTSTPLLLCGSATGIAPFFSYLEYYVLSKKFPEIYLYFGVRHMEDIHLLEELEKYEAIWKENNAHLHIKVCVSQEETATLATHKYSRFLFSGRMTEYIAKDIPSFAGNTYLCGGKDFVVSMKDFVAQNLPQSKIFVEKFF